MLLFIIFGWKGIKRTVGKGRCHCPRCGAERDYKHISLRNFFTLYFIPIIPLKKIGEYIECEACHGQFDVALLDYSPEQEAVNLQNEFNRVALRVLARAALADGPVNTMETDAIIAAASRYFDAQVTEDGVRRVADSVLADKGITLADDMREVAMGINDHGKESFIKAAYEVETADGELNDAEKQLLDALGETLSMSSAHMRGVVAELQEAAAAR